MPRPAAQDDLIYPDWFEGLWELESIDLDAPEARQKAAKAAQSLYIVRRTILKRTADTISYFVFYNELKYQL